MHDDSSCDRPTLKGGCQRTNEFADPPIERRSPRSLWSCRSATQSSWTPTCWQALADYYGADVPDEKRVTRRATSGAGKGAGLDKVIRANIDKSRSGAVTESYSVTAWPVRLMNDLVDRLDIYRDSSSNSAGRDIRRVADHL